MLVLYLPDDLEPSGTAYASAEHPRQRPGNSHWAKSLSELRKQGMHLIKLRKKLPLSKWILYRMFWELLCGITAVTWNKTMQDMLEILGILLYIFEVLLLLLINLIWGNKTVSILDLEKDETPVSGHLESLPVELGLKLVPNCKHHRASYQVGNHNNVVSTQFSCPIPGTWERDRSLRVCTSYSFTD